MQAVLMTMVIATSFVIAVTVPEMASTQTLPDGSTIVTANFILTVPEGCEPLPADEGRTKYQCPKGNIEVTAP